MEIYSKAVATIESTDDDEFGPNGGFTAVLSTPSLDRDGDRLLREEWKEFTQERYPLDIDHGMSVAETVGSFVPYWDDAGDRLMMKAHFADNDKVPNAKIARSLTTPDAVTGIRHVQSVSVAFMVDKTQKDAKAPFRELLNAGIVATPSNRDAVILASKAAGALRDALSDRTEGEVPEEIKKAVLDALTFKNVEERDEAKSVDDAETKSPEPYGHVTYADPEDGKYPIDTVAHIRAALAYINVQRNYDALGSHAAHVKRAIEAAARAHGIDVADGKSVENGESKSAERKSAAVYIDVLPRIDEDAFKKAIADVLVKAGATASGIGGDGALVQAIHDASSHLGAACPVIEVTDEGSGADDGANKTLSPEAFEKGLDEVLKSKESPAEAAAASDKEPAPADEAAESDEKRASRMEMLLFASEI